MSVNTNELTEARDHLKQARRLLMKYMQRTEDENDKRESGQSQPDMMLTDSISAVTRALLTIKAIGSDADWSK